MYKSEFCDVRYLPEKNVVLVTWKKFCCGEDYRAPLMYALNIIREYRCSYAADTRSGFENNPEDTQWVEDFFMPEAVKRGCDRICFIVDESNSLKRELEGQQAASENIIPFVYYNSIDEI